MVQFAQGSNGFEVGIQMDIKAAVDFFQVFEAVEGDESRAAEDIDIAFDFAHIYQGGQVL